MPGQNHYQTSKTSAGQLFNFLSALPSVLEGILLPNGEYHVFKITWPYNEAQETTEHPAMITLSKEINASHVEALIGYCPSTGKFLGENYEMRYQADDILTDHPTGRLVKLSADNCSFNYAFADIIANIISEERGGLSGEYCGSLGKQFKHDIARNVAKEIVEEHGWRYDLESFHFKTFVDELVERLPFCSSEERDS